MDLHPITPEPIAALVCRVSTAVVDRLTGGRADYPLLLSLAAQEGLHQLGVHSHVLYGRAAWVEILEEKERPVWALCEADHPHFWLETAHGETVDLSLSAAHLSHSKRDIGVRTVASPPILWTPEVPSFVRYEVEGAAEMEAESDRERKLIESVLREMREKCVRENLEPLEWPNEPVIFSGRRLLDDALGTFARFDRALGVHGVPPAPF